MDILIHADDFGISTGVCDTILECFDHGPLNSTSVIPNGYAFDYAMDEYGKRRIHGRFFRLAIHLNFMEGKPILPPEQVHLLVNDRGEFCHSFLSLWLSYERGTALHKRQLFEQVQNEAAAQIRRVADHFRNDFSIQVDSHQHFHMIPFVGRALLALSDQRRIDFIRLPQESFFLCLRPMRSVKNYIGSNLAKHLLLNRLSKRYRPLLRAAGIRSTDHFVGVLFTGDMSVAAVRRALSQLRQQSSSGIVEILFHPGKANEADRACWSNRADQEAYFFSRQRDLERAALMRLPEAANLAWGSGLPLEN